MTIIRIVVPLVHRADQHTIQLIVCNMIRVVEDDGDFNFTKVIDCDFHNTSPSIDVEIPKNMTYIDSVKFAGEMISKILSKKRIVAYFIIIN